MVDNGAGAFETDPAKIADLVASWLGPQRAAFDAMAAKAKALGRPEAVYKIVHDLAGMVEEYRSAVAAAGRPQLQLKPLAA